MTPVSDPPRGLDPGGDFVADFIQGRLTAYRRAVDALITLVARAPPSAPVLQIAFALLVFCVAPRLDYLLRHLSPSLGLELGERIDRTLAESLNDLLSVRFTPGQWAQAQLAVGDGGIGLRRRGGLTPVLQHLASWQVTSAAVTSILTASGHTLAATRLLINAECLLNGPLLSPLSDAALTTLATFAADPAAEAASDALSSLDAAAAALDRDIWLGEASPGAQARLHMSSGWGAGVGLLGAPTEHLLQLPDIVFRLNVCLRLGIPVAPSGPCAAVMGDHLCGKSLGGGFHAFCCPKTLGLRTRWIHNPLVEEFWPDSYGRRALRPLRTT